MNNIFSGIAAQFHEFYKSLGPTKRTALVASVMIGILAAGAVIFMASGKDYATLLTNIPADEAGAKQLMNGFTQANVPNVFLFAHYVMGLWGTQAAFPGLQLTDVLTEDGAKAVDKLSRNKCVHVLADSFNYAYGDQYKSILKSESDE